MFRFAPKVALRITSVVLKNEVYVLRTPIQARCFISGCSSTTREYSTIDVPTPLKRPVQLTFKDVEERVIKAVKAWDRFPQDRVQLLNLDARFHEDLGFDSLDVVEIVMALEDEFGYEIPDEATEKFKTPRDIFKYISEKEDVYE